MNYLWAIMLTVSIICSFFVGNPQEVLSEGINAAEDSVATVFSIGAMMCFWSGILKIAEEGGINKKLEHLLSPVVYRLFPKLERGGRASLKIAANIGANLLGMGNAATPAGIDAMTELDRINKKPYEPSEEMCIFTVMNTASLQIIPTTVISIRSLSGSVNPSEILIPVWICSALSMTLAILSMKIILKYSNRRNML